MRSCPFYGTVLNIHMYVCVCIYTYTHTPLYSLKMALKGQNMLLYSYLKCYLIEVVLEPIFTLFIRL
jgi:hypothetical protein